MVVNKINTRPPAYYYQFVWDTSKSGVSADNSGTFWVGRPPYIPDSRVVTSRSHAYKRGLGATDNSRHTTLIIRISSSSPRLIRSIASYAHKKDLIKLFRSCCCCLVRPGGRAF